MLVLQGVLGVLLLFVLLFFNDSCFVSVFKVSITIVQDIRLHIAIRVHPALARCVVYVVALCTCVQC